VRSRVRIKSNLLLPSNRKYSKESLNLKTKDFTSEFYTHFNDNSDNLLELKTSEVLVIKTGAYLSTVETIKPQDNIDNLIVNDEQLTLYNSGVNLSEEVTLVVTDQQITTAVQDSGLVEEEQLTGKLFYFVL
jgi:hypothetical protein